MACGSFNWKVGSKQSAMAESGCPGRPKVGPPLRQSIAKRHIARNDVVVEKRRPKAAFCFSGVRRRVPRRSGRLMNIDDHTSVGRQGGGAIVGDFQNHVGNTPTAIRPLATPSGAAGGNRRHVSARALHFLSQSRPWVRPEHSPNGGPAHDGEPFCGN